MEDPLMNSRHALSGMRFCHRNVAENPSQPCLVSGKVSSTEDTLLARLNVRVYSLISDSEKMLAEEVATGQDIDK